MKFSQMRTVYEDVDLTIETINKATILRLQQFLNGGQYLRTEKGKTYIKQDDPNHRHGSISEEIVREATELDIAVLTVIKALKNKEI